MRLRGAGQLRLYSLRDECAGQGPGQRTRQGRVRQRVPVRHVRQAHHQLGCDPRVLSQGVPRPFRDRGASAGKGDPRAVRQMGAGMAVGDCGFRIGQATTSLEGGPVTRHVWFGVLILWLAAPLDAQSLLYRSPNLSGTWVPDAGVVQFNFLHRFYYTPAPSKSVINFPTLTLAVGLPAHTTFG